MKKLQGAAKVCIVGQEPPPVHGSNIMFHTLEAALIQEGFEVEKVEKQFSRTEQEVGQPSWRKVLAIPRFLEALRRASRSCQVIVYFPAVSGGAFWIDFVGQFIVSRYRNSALVTYIHGIGLAENRLRRWGSRRILRRAKAVVVLGETLRDEVEWAVPRDRVVVIPNTALDVETERGGRTRAVTPSGAVLFLGNISRMKGADTFAQCAVGLLESGSATSVVMAGPYKSEEERRVIHRILDDSASGRQVQFVGPVDVQEKTDLLLSSDLLIMPSRQEAAPLVVLEALSCGLPVVAAPVGSIAEMVQDGSNGILVNSGNADDWVGCVRGLLTDGDQLAAMSACAQATYSERYSFLEFRRNWRNLLARVNESCSDT